MNAVSMLRLLATATLLLALAGCGREGAPPPVTVAGNDALAQHGGEWLLINYWAEWCKPCLEEIPQLNAFAKQHADRVRVLMVNYDGLAGEQLRTQAARFGIATVLLETDPSAQLGIGRPLVLPTTYVVGPDGKLRDTLIGPQTVDSLAEATRG